MKTLLTPFFAVVVCLLAPVDSFAWQDQPNDAKAGSNPVLLMPPRFDSSFQQTNLQVPPIPSSAPFVRPPNFPKNAVEIPQPNPRDVFDGQEANPFLNAPADRPFFARLSRTPDLFGDSLIVFNSQFMNNSFGTDIDADLALGGGARRFKNEQAKAFPTDRVFFYYQHFHNALEFQGNSGDSAQQSIDRFTFGVEKTFNDGQSSFEIRMPFSGHQGVALNGFNYSSDGVGNLIVSLKQLLHAEENIAIALGLATSVPTGSNLSGSGGFATFKFENEAVHLLPFLALQLTPDERWFFHAFAQVDTPVGDNTISTQPFGLPPAIRVDYKDETLMYLDASLGYWWYRNESIDAVLTGLATLVELHYTTSLEDAEFASASTVFIGRESNRINLLNLTVGAHAELTDSWAIRSAIVVPLRSGDDRFFDTEFQLALVKKLGSN
jgi:hypothetical protein